MPVIPLAIELCLDIVQLSIDIVQLSIDIGDEVRHQNKDLEGMGDDFEHTGGLLGSSMKRLKSMTNAGHNRWMLYMILFIIVVFFVLYYIIRWRT